MSVVRLDNSRNVLAITALVLSVLACSLQPVPVHVPDYANSPRLEHFDDGTRVVRMQAADLSARLDEIGPQK